MADEFIVSRVPTIHNAYWKTKADALSVPTGDIRLEVNAHSGLVVNTSYDADVCRYDTSYTHDGYTSTFLAMHLDQMVDIIIRSIDCSNVHEIGAGNGLFAAALATRGVTISASDPSVDDGHELVVKARFEDLTRQTYSALVLRHVLEHIPSPFDYVLGLKLLQHDAGSFFFEFPSWDYITENDAWFDVTYEHVNYFGVEVSEAMFDGRCTTGRVANGQYAYVSGRVSDFCLPTAQGHTVAEARDAIARLNRARTSSQHLLQTLKSESRSLVLWGAAQKGAMILQAMREVDIAPDVLVDVDPRKQGRFVGGGFPISGPSDFDRSRSTAIVIANSNYVSEIRKLTDDRCRYFVLEKELVEL